MKLTALNVLESAVMHAMANYKESWVDLVISSMNMHVARHGQFRVAPPPCVVCMSAPAPPTTYDGAHSKNLGHSPRCDHVPSSTFYFFATAAGKHRYYTARMIAPPAPPTGSNRPTPLSPLTEMTCAFDSRNHLRPPLEPRGTNLSYQQLRIEPPQLSGYS